MKNFLFLSAFLIAFVSCEKEDELTVDTIVADSGDEPEDLSHCETCPEQFIEDFSNYQSEIGITITAHSECSYEKMKQRFRFRMEPFSEVDGKFFYQYKKRSEYNYTRGAHETDWTTIPELYRYDYANKIAYLYNGVTDTDPRVLMDFNKEVGDTILLGEGVHGAINFIVEGKEVEFFEEIPFPKMYGSISVAAISGWNYDGAYISPYYPNPVVIDHEFDYYMGHDWTVDNFHDCFWFQHADGFSYELKNAETEEKLSAFYADGC